MDREITETGEDRVATKALARAQKRKYTGTTINQHSRNETTANMYVYININVYVDQKRYNYQAGKANTDAYSHTQESEMETLPEAHGRSAEQSQPPETCT